MKRGILLVALLLLPGLEARAQVSAGDFCKSANCVTELTPWLEQLEACKGTGVRIAALEKRVEDAKTALGTKEKELSTCVATATDTEKVAAEASEQVERLKKEIEGLKKDLEEEKKLAAGKGDSERLAEAVRLANDWKNEADRIKEEARKETADLKAEAEAAKKEASSLKTRIAALESKSPGDAKERGLQTFDTTPSAPSSDPEPKGDKQLQELQKQLDETKRALVEKDRQKEASEGAIRQVLTDLVDHLGKTFECASFSVELRGDKRVLKGTVAEGRHRDEAWRTVADSPLARLVHSSEIDVTTSGAQVCFVRTRAPGWLMARERGKGTQGTVTFLRRFLDPSVIPLLPAASGDAECATLGAVIKSLEPIESRPIGRDAVFVRSGDGKVAQCYDSGSGWKLRPVNALDGKAQAWLLVPEGAGRP